MAPLCIIAVFIFNSYNEALPWILETDEKGNIFQENKRQNLKGKLGRMRRYEEQVISGGKGTKANFYGNNDYIGEQ